MTMLEKPDSRLAQRAARGAVAEEGYEAEQTALDVLEQQSKVKPPRFEWWLMIAIMVVLTVLTFVNVVVRYLTKASFAYTEELSVALMVALVMIGASCALFRNHHIRVTFLVDRRPGTRRASDLLTQVATLITFGVLGYFGVRQTLEDIEFGAVSPGLGVPEWWFSSVLPVGCVLVCLRSASVLMRMLMSKEGGR